MCVCANANGISRSTDFGPALSAYAENNRRQIVLDRPYRPSQLFSASGAPLAFSLLFSLIRVTNCAGRSALFNRNVTGEARVVCVCVCVCVSVCVCVCVSVCVCVFFFPTVGGSSTTPVPFSSSAIFFSRWRQNSRRLIFSCFF